MNKGSELLIKILEDIDNLESENMSRILSDNGQKYDSVEIQNDILKCNPGLLNLFVVYSKENQLLGYFRYNNDGENRIIVKSFQIKDGKNKGYALRRLLNIAYNALYYSSYEENLEITSWVFKTNIKSIKFHQKLGFKYASSNRDAIKYSISKKELLSYFNKIGLHQYFNTYSHPGLFPIRVLQHNLPHTIENHKSSRINELKNAVLKNQINTGIKYLITNESFIIIHADPVSKSIKISEQFLAFLWSFIYSTFVVFEEGIQTKISKNGSTWDGKIDTKPIVTRASKLLDWSISLSKEFSFWPINLPNPDITNNAFEQVYIEKANGIFLKSAVYLINHEIAHLINKHWDVIKDIRLKSPETRTKEDICLYKEIEADADAYAREIIIDSNDEEKEKIISGISIVHAHVASLFIINHPCDLIGSLHPDIDTRLFNSIEALNLEDEKNKDYILLYCAILINKFINIHSTELERCNFKFVSKTEIETALDYYNFMFKTIDEIKEHFKQ